MKAVKEIVRKYYKYIEEPWVQPVLADDGTLGGNNFACWASSYYNSGYHAYLAFNGIQDNGNNYGGWESASVSTADFIFYSPNPLKISQIGYTAFSPYCTYGGTIYGSNDNNTWIELTTFDFNSVSTSTQNIIQMPNTTAYKYYKIHSTNYGSTHGISELYITATQQIVQESTSSDYDFYEDVEVREVVSEESNGITTYYAVRN